MKNKLLLFIAAIVCCMFTFPLFRENISSVFLISTAILTLLYLFLNKGKLQFKIETLLYTLPFFVVVFTNFFTVNAEMDWKNISKSLMFLIFPIVFLNIPSSVFKHLENRFLYVFKISCLMISVFYITSFLLNHPFSDFFKENYNESVFRKYVYNLSVFKVHPTYFSLFLNVGIVHSLLNFKKKLKYLNLFFAFFFIIMILLLSSRIMIVISFISILYVLTKDVSFKKRYFIPVATAFLFGLFFLPGIKSRFIEAYNDFNKPPSGLYHNSTNIRRSIIDCSLTILKDNYVRGVGFSNIQNELNDCYKLNYSSNFYENHDYLTHNYFMYIFIGSGIIGFVAFLVYLFVIIKKCFKINNTTLNVILYSSIALFFVEDFLYRHYGLFFFNLFIFSYFRFYEYISNKNVLNDQ